MCLVATRVPSSYLVQSAVDELDRMCACLNEAERSSSLVGKYTVSPRSLRHEFQLSLSQVTVEGLREQTKAVLERRRLPIEVTAQLDRLSGHTGVVRSKSLARSPSSSRRSPPRAPLQTFNSQTGTSPRESLVAYWEFENLHPIIVEDLKVFATISSDPAQPSGTFSFPSSSCSSSTTTGGPNVSTTPELSVPIFSIPDVRGESSQNLPSNRTSNRSSPFEGSAMHVHQQAGGHLALNESSGPPALDPSWRNFLEHLGF